ncbi:hypothetical protein FQN55_007720 [Onygenales sp. PD_40]|nr:hypothetical protein FQN55_007720 [Onygenales sp. PD_40]
MGDPISVAGLAIGAVDVLIRLGERTAELISDAHAFENDSAGLHNLVKDETVQNKLLRNLLFSQCSVYGGKTLFDQFDTDIQQQIELMCTEVKSILHEAVEVLERRYGVSDASDSSRGAPALSSPTSFLKRGGSSPSLPTLIRWSFRDKKRVEAILYSFGDRNSRLKRKVEFCCLASQLGVYPEHLKHLQTDETSRKLGFDKDASLRLVRRDSGPCQESLELTDPSWDSCLGEIKPTEHQGSFEAFEKDSVAYIQENHCYNPPGPAGPIDSRTKTRINALAKLLHQPKEQIFRVLPCIGWKYLPQHGSISFVFEVQPRPVGAPVSLQRLLFDSRRRPGLGDKFRLALGLSKCITQMHMVQWLHESFRSDNILLFPHQTGGTSRAVVDADTDTDTNPNPHLGVNYSEPWVLGFEFSRPEPFFSSGQADFEPQRDIYRHPERQGRPESLFKKEHDIYALGVVLLEIGLWEPALKLERNRFAHAQDPRAVQAQLVKHARKRLEAHVGRRYAEAVVKCLTGDFGVDDDTKEDIMLQQAFRVQVVDVIEMAASWV